MDTKEYNFSISARIPADVFLGMTICWILLALKHKPDHKPKRCCPSSLPYHISSFSFTGYEEDITGKIVKIKTEDKHLSFLKTGAFQGYRVPASASEANALNIFNNQITGAKTLS